MACLGQDCESTRIRILYRRLCQAQFAPTAFPRKWKCKTWTSRPSFHSIPPIAWTCDFDNHRSRDFSFPYIHTRTGCFGRPRSVAVPSRDHMSGMCPRRSVHSNHGGAIALHNRIESRPIWGKGDTRAADDCHSNRDASEAFHCFIFRWIVIRWVPISLAICLWLSPLANLTMWSSFIWVPFSFDFPTLTFARTNARVETSISN